MTRDEFVQELEFIFNVAEGTLKPETELDSLKAWDSIGLLSVITLMKQVGAKVKADQLSESKIVGDLIQSAGDNLD